jgi:ribonuclease HII
MEIGIDEVGRGPLFGRVYTAAVILPKDDSFNHFNMKDSKRFHSKKKIQEMSKYIKENAIAWTVSWEDENTIDKMNILQATQQSMHSCINSILKTHKLMEGYSYQLLIDGNYFKPYYYYNPTNKMIEQLSHECIVGGDDKYSAIAAASILAKVARDKYIEELCLEYPYLDTRYSIASNKGYGAKKHMDGIVQYGITEWHRKSFTTVRKGKKNEKCETETIKVCQLSGENISSKIVEEDGLVPPFLKVEKVEKVGLAPPFLKVGLAPPFLKVDLAPPFLKVEKVEKVENYTCNMTESCPINSNCSSLSPECKKYNSTNYAPFF